MRELPVGAASGIARVGDRLFVIADDEHRLAVLDVDGAGPVRVVPFSDDAASAAPAEGKRTKRDLEALTVAHGALVGIGSGSTARRRWGFSWAVDDAGELAGAPSPLDLAPLYAGLADRIPDLNIEGATFARERLLLFQRGNGPGGVNAVVELAWKGDVQATLRPDAIEAVHEHHLGTVDGVRLCFTDAACAGERIVFTAVAEAALSTYDDGPCVGAAVGILGGPMFHLDPPVKVEGVEVAAIDGDTIDLLLVIDDDDPETAARLFSARIG